VQGLLGLWRIWPTSGCEHSDEKILLFGKGGGLALSEKTGTLLFASLPIDIRIGQGGDDGVPLLESAPDCETAALFQQIAVKVAEACEKTGSS
jgi:ATP-binding protein involved in chromosome partitioning